MTGITEKVQFWFWVNYQWNKLNGLLVHSKCSQQYWCSLSWNALKNWWGLVGTYGCWWSSVSQHPHEQSHTQRSRYYMIYMGLVWFCDRAEPDFTGLKVCSITSDERPTEENKTEEYVNYTAPNLENKMLLICKKKA